MNIRNVNIPLLAFGGAALFCFGAGVVYAAQGADIKKLQSEMTDVKSFISESRSTTKLVTELAVKIDILTAAQEKTSQKVDDIRVMVRN